MRNIIDEILEKKSRNIPITDWLQPSRPRWDLVSNRISRIRAIPHAINLLDLICYRFEIEDIEKYPEIESECHEVRFPGGVVNEISRYIPIGLVACIEAYFRQVYADLIDYGDPYKQNAAEFSDIKFNIKTAISLERADLSIGDFISHLLPINSFEGIESTMTKLTGSNFSQALEREIENSKELQQTELLIGSEEDYIKRGYKIISGGLVVPTSQKLHRDMVCAIKDVFELRHRLCHEASPIMSDHDDAVISEAPGAVLRFLVVSEAVVERMLS
ncbi:hypothetical protein H6G20_12590 [Desertifilum sp. FACHB-1129]|uniref:RiboL-PSP-HEPN domain-containing protein n=2 Tax=Desertifilum tharense IPPAS B-1220 TaxID=1781255 RepID=A0A1E5QM15_9CYAN|nr:MULTISPECIES: hypothetical protein [Desertifilum]MDA0212933.1 hypothetical protein [Cyanobacteria bacterium FC1]MBD2312500.1 hypothetical protein [Desertifilum sp. FACHB-1129]MBD2323442.1 hypothetical protein [Desertifilum sp. FACHB-866]MBD2333287.1 hypothetical protein [Desertifilum sp. FACHB-868]OEJ75668.1 hypothetical protein BH720_08490 [Desertifilum tharense IPPAS B-1220]